MKFRQIFFILPVLCLFFAACGGSAIGDAQEFSPNEPPSIISIKAVNFDGTEITQLDIEPYKQFKLIVEAVDPDNNPLEYKFDSESGTFAGISSNQKGCTAVFKTGSVKGGQNIELWAGVSDGNGAIVRQSFNLGTGKLGPTITAVFDKTIFKPNESVKLSVTANCSGFFQLNSDGNKNFDFEKDMYRYSYSPNKTTDFILGGPEFTSYADMQLKPRADNTYTHETIYELVLVFRDGLFQNSNFPQDICVDGTGPKVKVFSPDIKDPFDFNPEIIITFDENIGYADSSCLQIEPSDAKIKLLRISKNQAFFSVTGLKALSDYSATVRGVKDIAGNVMEDSAPYSFKTISGNLQIKDDKGNTKYDAYRGFEESSVNLKAYLKNGEIGIAQVVLSVESPSNGVSVDSAGKVTINPRDLMNEDDVTVKIKAYQSSTGETSYYTITINPWYEIYSAKCDSDLEMLKNNLNGRFKLMENINVEEVNSGNNIITPIGSFANASKNKPFTGIFDGNDKTLSNFKIQASNQYAALFAYNKGTIKKLIVDKAELTSSGNYVGIICARNDNTIEECEVKNSKIYGDNSYKGGIAAVNNSKITRCNVSGIDIYGVQNCGAIAGGNNNGEINSCIASGKIVAYNGTSGGIVGEFNGGSISNCESSCTLESDDLNNGDQTNFGGLIGYVKNASILNCSSTGVAIASKANNVGGLIGYASDVSILNCFSTGNVQGAQSTGGLLGYLESTGSISKVNIDNCHHNGDSVTGTSQVGGLIGIINNNSSAEINVKDCYSTSNIISTGDNVGGLVGWVSSSVVNLGASPQLIINNCYHKTGSVSGNNNVGGVIGTVGKLGPNDTAFVKCKISGTTYADCDVTGNDYIGGLIGIYNKCGKLEIVGTTDVNIKSTGMVTGHDYVGGLIGYAKEFSGGDGSALSFCNSESEVTGNTYIGGFIGSMSGGRIDKSTISADNSYSSGAVKGNSNVGGLAGSVENKVIIISCYSISGVSLNDSSTTSPQFFGGLIGYCSVSDIKDSYSKGNVSVNISAGSNIGGLIGGINLYSGSSSVLRCFHSNGKVAGRDYVGGLIGYIYSNVDSNKATIEQCFANCEVNAGNLLAGGLIGQISYTEILNCYSRGKVTGNNFIGGLIGSGTDTSKIKYCYAAYNSSDLSVAPFVGGLVGGGTIGDITSSFYSGTTNGHGQNVDIDALKSISTYTSSTNPLLDWSIGIKGASDKTWLIDSGTNSGFPYLANIPEALQK